MLSEISTRHWTGDLKQEELGSLACLQRINLNGKERTSLPISRSSPRQALAALGSATIDRRWRISAPECEGCWLLQPIWRCRPNQRGTIWADINTEGAKKKKKVQLFSPLLFTWFPWVAPLMIVFLQHFLAKVCFNFKKCEAWLRDKEKFWISTSQMDFILLFYSVKKRKLVLLSNSSAKPIFAPAIGQQSVVSPQTVSTVMRWLLLVPSLSQCCQCQRFITSAILWELKINHSFAINQLIFSAKEHAVEHFQEGLRRALDTFIWDPI